MDKKKKILAFSGKRGGYGAMRDMLLRLDKAEWCDLHLALGPMHSDIAYGRSIEEVSEDFHEWVVHGYPSSSKSTEMASILHGLAADEITGYDCLIIFGDRGESLMAAYWAVLNNIPIAHIQAGDRSGTQADRDWETM